VRYAIPVYVVLAAICVAEVTRPPYSGLSPQEAFQESFEHSQQYGFVAGIVGSALTTREILESRRKINCSNN
jgi:hypothetical protein